MQAEIITIGTEILLGQIVDTNAAFLARQLAKVGVNVYRKSTIGDNEKRIAEAVQNALAHCDLVITSGGIGPTIDDKTRQAVAIATGCRLVLDENLLEDITDFFRRRGMEMGDNNPRQAYIPENARPIPNPVGTAPGFIAEYRGSYVITLPGVPRELTYLMEHTVLPFIQREYGLETVIKSRLLRTAGVGESAIDRQIADLEVSSNPTVGLAAHPGAVDVRIAARAKDAEQAQQLLDEMEDRIRKRLGDTIYGIDKETIEAVVVKLVSNHRFQLAVVETNTGGHLADRLTGVADGFNIVKRALTVPLSQAGVALSNDLSTTDSISKETAETLAEQIRKKADADIGLAIVGDQDPEVGPHSRQTGNTYIGISLPGSTASQHIHFGGISADARTRITNSALEMLRTYLLKISAGSDMTRS